jgi:hypothetical protein
MELSSSHSGRAGERRTAGFSIPTASRPGRIPQYEVDRIGTIKFA